MPDNKNNIRPSFDKLDDQIVDMVSNHVRRRRAEYEDMARKLHAGLKEDAIRYTEMAADGQISSDELQTLIEMRWAKLKVEMLAEASLAKGRAEGIAIDVLKFA
ncbi:MAG TPA: hypothetical protein PK858_06270, partial [Saprospiraceae bacterium]|nr:hypothetical protein [Saprospiraceae bacterium]